jgi:hypothetical protein
MTLEALKTYCGRYPTKSGERVDMPKAIYDQIIALAERGEHRCEKRSENKWLELAERCEERAREWDYCYGSGCDARAVASAVLRELASDLKELK